MRWTGRPALDRRRLTVRDVLKRLGVAGLRTGEVGAGVAEPPVVDPQLVARRLRHTLDRREQRRPRLRVRLDDRFAVDRLGSH